ncbi:preprotein translocase subunit Sec61beta [Candidatus Woesearchaeota archaeon]|nr:preprotein translocase subunit Sec61beta [Candidatus Woesearchaeota archaeon]
MAQPRVNLPSSGAGLTRYFDDYQSKIRFKPGHVIILAVVVAIIVILLNIYGRAVLGF